MLVEGGSRNTGRLGQFGYRNLLGRLLCCQCEDRIGEFGTDTLIAGIINWLAGHGFSNSYLFHDAHLPLFENGLPPRIERTGQCGVDMLGVW